MAQVKEEETNYFKADRIKKRIDDLRDDWDRKENNPYQQQNITLNISKAQKQLFQLSGEQY